MSLDPAHRTKFPYVATFHGPASHGHDRRPPAQYNASFEGTDSQDGPKWRGARNSGLIRDRDLEPSLWI